MEDEIHETYQNETINGIGLNGGRFHDERNNLKREEGIVVGMTVGSLCRSKSANEISDMIIEEGTSNVIEGRDLRRRKSCLLT